MVLTALVVVLILALVSWFVVRAIWQQLGGEPEYARAIARAVSNGDLAMDIRTDAHDNSSLLVALKDMRARLASIAFQTNILALNAAVEAARAGEQGRETMGHIVASVKKVQDIMAEIAEAGQHQRDGIDEMGGAIDNLDAMTEQPAALVEQAAAAAASLSAQTGQLSGALSVFKLDGQSGQIGHSGVLTPR